jgi:hypothetical protein
MTLGMMRAAAMEVAPDLDLELAEFIDNEQINLLGGEPPASNKPARPTKAHNQIAGRPALIGKGTNLQSAEQRLVPVDSARLR